MRRKIAVVTGTRAEYGLLYWLMKEIQAEPELQLQLLVTGAHLSPEFGLTWKEIEADGFAIDAKVEMLLSGDTSVAITKSLGLGVIGFADALERLKPDIIVILGDRYEMLGVAAASVLAGISIAHLYGGEITVGAYDDSFRHAITKMSSMHFVAREEYGRRVVQMGEAPESVYVVGPACLDGIRNAELPVREELERYLGIPLSYPLFVITCHPETLSRITSEEQVGQLLSALTRFPSATMIFTGANADTDGRIINERIAAFCAEASEKRVFVQSLGSRRYWGLLSLADAVIGNSSSGISEAPFFGLPVVNIGRRQEGRLRDNMIIDCLFEAGDIEKAVKTAISRGRQLGKVFSGFPSPAKQIKDNLKTSELRLLKHFFSIPWME